MSFRCLAATTSLLCLFLSPLACAQSSEPIGLAMADGRLFPLRSTSFHSEVVDGVALVTVRQVFANPLKESIEAVYTFPLPDKAAVQGMTMTLGKRSIEGKIKERKQAVATYKKAMRRGHTAALLTQQRPNIFTQYVANVLPGEEIAVELRYLEDLPYEKGRYTLVIPMTVGPRFTPPKSGVDPHAVPSGFGTHTIHSVPVVDLSVSLPHGVQPEAVTSSSHKIVLRRQGRSLVVGLNLKDRRPTKDFVLSFLTAKSSIAAQFSTHRSEGDGTFALHITPPLEPAPEQAIPRAVYLVLDCSGSMNGQPMRAAQAVATETLRRLRPYDTFQIMRFSDRASGMSHEPLPATAANIQHGLRFLMGLRSGGGTQMLNGIRAALAGPRDPSRLRMIHFLTDGFIGNETQILDVVKESLQRARIFPLGVGSSPNRFLIDRLARVGRGAATYVSTDASAVKIQRLAEQFVERVRTPCLSDLRVHWDGLSVAQVTPEVVPDLYSAQPIVLHGRYLQSGEGTVRITGRRGGETFELSMPVVLPEKNPHNRVLPTLWARMRILALMLEQGNSNQPAIRTEVTKLALRHQLMSRYTAFVAVDHIYATEGGEPRRMAQPIPLPSGMEEFDYSMGEEDRLMDRPFDNPQFNDTIGLGEGAGHAFTGRQRSQRNLRAACGRSAISSPVDRALNWLASHQQVDGHWSGHGRNDRTEAPRSAGSATSSSEPSNIEVTALLLLAYHGAGNTHRQGRHKREVRSGLKWLRSQLQSKGQIGNGSNHQAFMDHALGTLAFAEAYGMTKSGIWKGSIHQAVQHLQQRIATEASRARGSSLSTTERALALSALCSADLAGIAVDHAQLRYLHESTHSETPRSFEDLAGTAWLRILSGEKPETAKTLAAQLSALHSQAQANPNQDPLAWHIATLACFHAGGEYWKKWESNLRRVTVAAIQKKADKSRAETPLIASSGVALRTEALRTLTLEIYYRFGRVFGGRVR